MKVLILAAGYATRLWPLTINTPKPLLRVRNKPMVEYIIDRAEDIKAVDTIFIITNSRFVRYFKNWQSRYRSSKRIVVIDNGINKLNERRGSVGDIIYAVYEEKIQDDLLVIGGDNIFSQDLSTFLETLSLHPKNVTIGLYDVKDKALASKYGIVAVNGNSRVESFEEKPAQPKSTLAAMCLYYIPKDKLAMLESYQREGNPLDMAGLFIKWLTAQEDVYSHIFKGEWLDIGDKDSLKKAGTVVWK